MAGVEPSGPRAGREARALLKDAKRFLGQAAELELRPANFGEEARSLSQSIRVQLAHDQLAAIPLDRLRQATSGRLRLGPLESNGYRTVADVSAVSQARLQAIPGVGPQTAAQVVAAARQIARSIAEQVPVRLDPDRRDSEQTTLLAVLRRFAAAEQAVAPLRGELGTITPSLEELVSRARAANSRVRMFFLGRQRKEDVAEAVRLLSVTMAQEATKLLISEVANALDAAPAPSLDRDDLWQDFLENASGYFTSLEILGEIDVDAVEGYLSEEIVARVNQQPIDLKALHDVSLRGYQSFGAKFALVQRRTILGDEMGLGKTI